MWSPATALAISEQYRIAEEHTLKVRSELYRLRCSGEIFVEQENTCLKLTYGNESVIKQPLWLLTILQEIYQVDSADYLWVLLQQENAENHKNLRLTADILVLIIFIVLAVVTIAAYI